MSQPSDKETEPAHKKKLYAELSKHAHIRYITVDYDGSGDSGGINDVKFFDCFDGEIIPELSEHLTQCIEDYVYDVLGSQCCGWENDDGAFGTVNIDTTARTAEFQHNTRYTATSEETFIF